jgi:hypothetical protein
VGQAGGRGAVERGRSVGGEGWRGSPLAHSPGRRVLRVRLLRLPAVRRQDRLVVGPGRELHPRRSRPRQMQQRPPAAE